MPLPCEIAARAVHFGLTSFPCASEEAGQLGGTHDVGDMARAKFYMPPVCFIVARSLGGHVIGREGRLPWKLRSDLGRFRELTTKHAIIMGRKTYDSIGKPLPNRFNVVVSRTDANDGAGLDLHGTGTKLMHSKSTEDALFCSDLFAILNGSKKIFVIGGAEVYRKFSNNVDRVYLTEVHADVQGDAYFDQSFPETDWRTSHKRKIERSSFDEFASSFSVLDRRTSAKRIRTFSEVVEESRLRLKSLTDRDARLIEGYARQHLEADGEGQMGFFFKGSEVR